MAILIDRFGEDSEYVQCWKWSEEAEKKEKEEREKVFKEIEEILKGEEDEGTEKENNG